MAMAAPNHKHHLMQHVIELDAAVLSMEAKAGEAVRPTTAHNLFQS